MDQMMMDFKGKVQEGAFDDAFDIYWSGLGNVLKRQGMYSQDRQVLTALFPNGEFIAPVLRERNLSWAHLMLGVAYWNTGLPHLAVRHLGRAYGRGGNDSFAMVGPRTLYLAKCHILLGQLVQARDLLHEFLRADFYPVGNQISANLEFGHLVAVTGGPSEAQKYVTEAGRLIEDNLGDLSGFQKDVHWLDAILKWQVDDLNGATELAQSLTKAEEGRYQFKGHLLLAAVSRKQSNHRQARSHIKCAHGCLKSETTSHQFGNLMIEQSKLELSLGRPEEAMESGYAALMCVKTGDFCPVWIESELMLCMAHLALHKRDLAARYLESAEERLARLGNELTFVSLVKRHRMVSNCLGAGHTAQADGTDSDEGPMETTEAMPIHWDVFVSYASEDKDVVSPLVAALRERGLTVWYAPKELRIGDRLLKKIDEGLARSSFGIVVLSHDFFDKKWTQLELDGLIALEGRRSGRILPVRHGVTDEDVKGFSPILAGRVAGRIEEGTEPLAQRLADEIGGEDGAGLEGGGFGVLELDEDWELVGGVNSVRGFVAEATYNTENGVAPPFKVIFRGLRLAQEQMSQIGNAGHCPASDRVRRVALRKWIDKYRERRCHLTMGVSWIMSGPFMVGQRYLCSQAEIIRSIVALLELFHARSLTPQECRFTKFDIWYDGLPAPSGRVSLDPEQTEELKKSTDVDNITVLRRGYGLSVSDLPRNVIVDQAIPVLVYKVLEYRKKGGQGKVEELLDLSRWSCGLA